MKNAIVLYENRRKQQQQICTLKKTSERKSLQNVLLNFSLYRIIILVVLFHCFSFSFDGTSERGWWSIE